MMPFEIKLHYLPLAVPADAEGIARFLPFISEARRERLLGCPSLERRKRSLYAELLLREVIACECGLSNGEIVFSENKYGKLYLEGREHFYFNLSHTDGAVVVAVSAEEVGVDIERIRPVKPGIARRFFAPEEAAYVEEAEDGRLKRFYEIWTKKEAYVKQLGVGFHHPPSSFSVLDQDIADRLTTFERDGYMISVCDAKSQSKLTFLERSEKDMFFFTDL